MVFNRLCQSTLSKPYLLTKGTFPMAIQYCMLIPVCHKTYKHLTLRKGAKEGHQMYYMIFRCKYQQWLAKMIGLLNDSWEKNCSQSSEWQRFFTIRYDSVYLMCSKKLTGSQLSLPHCFQLWPLTLVILTEVFKTVKGFTTILRSFIKRQWRQLWRRATGDVGRS